MNSSEYYKGKISELNGIKSQIKSVLAQFEPCESALTKSEKYVEEITINGEPIDQGKLVDVSNTLKNAESDLNAIIAECDMKIDDFNALYRQALAREAAIREAERRAQARQSRNLTESRD